MLTEPLTFISLTGYICLILLAFQLATGRTIVDREQAFHSSILLLLLSLGYYAAQTIPGFDLREHGEKPVVLAPVLITITAIALWHRYYLVVAIISVACLGFVLGLYEDASLWSYLLDPAVTILALVIVWRNRQAFRQVSISEQNAQLWPLVTVGVFLAYAVACSYYDPEVFRHVLVVEDGFVEWMTVVALLVTMAVCIRRFMLLRRARSGLFLAVTALLAAFCLFGAGEEISWGQRILGLESPDYFQENNAQGEIGLHNLVVEIDGEEVKLNKLIFGTGLAIGLSIYLFVATPLYRRRPAVKGFFDAIAAPMPKNYHIIGYLVIVAVVELLIDHSKRGEMTEFAGAIMFSLNVIFPDNAALFKAEAAESTDE